MNRLVLPFLSVGAALLSTVSVQAAALTVAEFGAVTRVTVPALEEGAWTINKSVRAFDIRTGAVDLGMVEPALPGASRLSAVEVWEGRTDTGVSIRFTCDCTTSHFYGEEGVLIVDIAERSPPEVEPEEAQASVDADYTEVLAPGDADDAPPPARGGRKPEPRLARKSDEPKPDHTERAPLIERVEAALARTEPARDRPVRNRPEREEPKKSAPEKTETEKPEPRRVIPVQATAKQIVRTAPLRAAAPRPSPVRARRGEEPDETVFYAPTPRRKPETPARPTAPAPEGEDAAIDALREAVLSRLAIGVEQGRITMEADDGARRQYVPAGCPDEAALDLKRLTGSDDFRSTLPTLRADVYDEMKQVNPAAVRALARHFLAFGLGEEARNVIAAFDGDGAAEKLIIEMATVLEGDGATMSSGLLIKPECGPRAAVWRATVAAESETGTVRDIYDEARNTVLDLPDPLRKILGARIALGLIDEGDREAAMRLWRNLERAAGPDTPELDLLEAHTDEANQLESLLTIARSRSPLAGEAAQRAAAMLLQKEDRARAERLGATLEDLAFIYRDTDAETELSFALAQLQARYGDLASALTALAKKADDQPERAEHWRSIARETIRVATEGADPVARPHDFDTILASLKYLDDSPASDGAKFSLVRKLMDVGGAHIVESVLTRKIRDRSPEARRLLAEARLLMGDAAGARRLLDGLKGEDSETLQARAALQGASGTADTARDRFGPVGTVPREASISGARALMEKTEEDLSIIEELLADG